MSDALLPLQNPPPARRGRGRPKGSRNKAAGAADLRKYVEARYGGMTPGQQLAELCMVTPKDLKAAGGDMVRALAAKARELAVELGIDNAPAFLMLQKAQLELMAYVHPKQAQAAPTKPGQKAVAIMVPEGQALDLVDGGADAPLLSFVDEEPA